MAAPPKAPSSRAGIKGLPEISFRRGLNSIQQNGLLLREGECSALVNADLDIFGGVGIRDDVATIVSGLGAVHSIYRKGTDIFVGHGTTLSRIHATTYAVTTVTTGLAGTHICMQGIGNWLLLSDGTNKKKVYIPTLAVYEWGFSSPAATAPPVGAAGAAGNPEGPSYNLYYTYVAKFPDGSEYESDLSPLATVAVTSQKITWTLPGTVPDAQITHLRLYRDTDTVVLSQTLEVLRQNVEAVPALPIGYPDRYYTQEIALRTTAKKVLQDMQDITVVTGPFLVAEVAVGTTTYSDDLANATLELKIPHSNENFTPIMAYKKFIRYAKRIFGIGAAGYDNVVWWGQPYQWDSLDAGWDGYNSTTFDDDTDTTLREMEGTVYVGGRSGWLRLKGSDPSNWTLSGSLSVSGPASDRLCVLTKFGLIYPCPDGVWKFNGYSSELFAPQIKDLMASVNWDAIDQAFCLWDGRFFRFFYPSGTATANDRELMIDTIAGEAELRPTESTLAVSAGYFDRVSQKTYFGTSDGKILEGVGTASRTLSITTKEYIVGDGFNAESKGMLHYDVDTKGEALIVTTVYDGVDQSSFTIVADGRVKSSHSLPKGNCKRIGFKLSITTALAPILYEPWFIE